MQKNKNRHRKILLITLLAMLTAVSVVAGIICKNLFTVAVYYRFTLENIGVIFAGVFFGPVAGALVGAASDIISTALIPPANFPTITAGSISGANPAVNPVISLGAVCVGLVSGIMAKYVVKKRGLRQYILSAASAHLLGQVLIKSVGKILYFGMPWYGIAIGLVCSAVACIIEVMILRLLMKNAEIRKFIARITEGNGAEAEVGETEK